MTLRALLLLATCGATLPGTAQTIQVNKENRTIAITATEKSVAQADTATLHVGFIAYGADSAGAYAAGSRASNAIHQALLSAGVAEDAIESESQSVSLVQDYQTDKLTQAQRAQRQFQVTQSWAARTGATEAARVLDVAVKAGANQSGQIEWGMKDEGALAASAAAKALLRARTIAEEMARGLNAKVGILVYASNETEAEPILPVRGRPVAMAMKAEAVPPLSINPRRIERSATVHAVFAIE